MPQWRTAERSGSALLQPRHSPRCLQVEELPTSMCPERLFNNGLAEQGFVATIVINHQMILPRFHKGGGMPSTPTALVVEHDDRWAAVQIITTIRPQIGLFRFVLPCSGSSCCTGVSSACRLCRALTNSVSRSASGCKVSPNRTIHSLSVLCANDTCCRAAICSSRYNGKGSSLVFRDERSFNHRVSYSPESPVSSHCHLTAISSSSGPAAAGQAIEIFWSSAIRISGQVGAIAHPSASPVRSMCTAWFESCDFPFLSRLD